MGTEGTRSLCTTIWNRRTSENMEAPRQRRQFAHLLRATRGRWMEQETRSIPIVIILKAPIKYRDLARLILDIVTWPNSTNQQFPKASQVKKVAKYMKNIQFCDPASDKVLTQERSLSIRKFTNRPKVTKVWSNFLADAVIMTCFGQVILIWSI